MERKVERIEAASVPTTPLRFFLGLKETAGYFDRMAMGLRALGASATVADLSAHPFRYAVECGWWRLPARALGDRRRKSGRLARWTAFLLQPVLAILVIVWAVPRHDVFILAGMPRVPTLIACGLLRLARKRIIMSLHGTDSRPPYLDGFNPAAIEGDPIGLIRATRRQRRAVQAMEKWSDCVISHTASSQFLSKPFVSSLWLGIPALASAPQRRSRPDRRVRVTHAPSHPQGKGTEIVRQSVNELIADGWPVDYIELTGVAHARVLDALADSDVVVDQVYSDQPIPGFATEAASCGVPTIIGGYEWDTIRAENATVPWPPTIQVRPEDIKEALQSLVRDEDARQRAGSAAKAYAESRLEPRAVAERLVQIAQGSAPPEAMVSPLSLGVIHGCGLPMHRSNALIRGIVEAGDVRALAVEDKPLLERRLLDKAQDCAVPSAPD